MHIYNLIRCADLDKLSSIFGKKTSKADSDVRVVKIKNKLAKFLINIYYIYLHELLLMGWLGTNQITIFNLLQPKYIIRSRDVLQKQTSILRQINLLEEAFITLQSKHEELSFSAVKSR
jgi:hypothetical protein